MGPQNLPRRDREQTEHDLLAAARKLLAAGVNPTQRNLAAETREAIGYTAPTIGFIVKRMKDDGRWLTAEEQERAEGIKRVNFTLGWADRSARTGAKTEARRAAAIAPAAGPGPGPRRPLGPLWREILESRRLARERAAWGLASPCPIGPKAVAS